MERTQVTSSNILSVGYEADQGILEIEFTSGAVYQYSGVPAWAFEGIMAADSKGKYFNANVKNSYPYIKL
jgi:hypothetical protein